MMYEFWRHYPYYPLDIEPFCYTPNEFEKKKDPVGTGRQALKERIEL